MTSSATHLPAGASADDYLRHVAAALREGRDIIPPRTRAHLLALGERYPALARRYREDAASYGLPDRWLDPPEPHTTDDAARLIATLMADPSTWGRVIQHCIRAADGREAARG